MKLKPMDATMRRTLLNESLGYWRTASGEEKGVEMMLMFGLAYGRGGIKELLRCMDIANAPERYAGAIIDFIENGGQP